MNRNIALLIMASALAGCHKAPEGEVVVIVNGDEITRAELNAAVAQVPSKGDPKLIRNSVLDQLVNERLMVQAAKNSGLNKTQDYVLKSRAAENLILSSMFVQQTVGTASQPHVNDTDDFIRANPTRFANRVLLVVDQIKIPRQNVNDAWLKDAKSIDEIAQALMAHSATFQRGRAALDSLALEPDVYNRIAAVPAGRPFAVVDNGMLVLSSTIAKQAAPLAGEDARTAATAILKQKASRAGLDNRLKALRAEAKIDYQPGFSPPPVPAKAPPSS